VRREAIVSPLRTVVGGFDDALKSIKMENVGTTGGRIMATMLNELQRRQGRYALETLCIGGGRGIAALFERA